MDMHEKLELAELRSQNKRLILELEGIVHFADGFGVRGSGPIADELERFLNGAREALAKVNGK